MWTEPQLGFRAAAAAAARSCDFSSHDIAECDLNQVVKEVVVEHQVPVSAAVAPGVPVYLEHTTVCMFM